MLEQTKETKDELVFESKYKLRQFIPSIIFILFGLVLLYRKFEFDYYYEQGLPGFFAFNDPRLGLLVFSTIAIGGGLLLIAISYRFMRLKIDKKSNLVEYEDANLTYCKKQSTLANTAKEIILRFDNIYSQEILF